MDEDEEFSLSPFVSSVITECTSYLNDPREENKMEVLKPSQWIEPVEVHCTLGCEDDVTDHTRKQNSEKTLEKVTKPADHVEIVLGYKHNVHAKTSAFHGVPLPPVVKQYVQSMVDKHWFNWRSKGELPTAQTPLEQRRLSKTYYLILQKAEEHLQQMIMTFLTLSHRRASNSNHFRSPPLHKIHREMNCREGKGVTRKIDSHSLDQGTTSPDVLEGSRRKRRRLFESPMQHLSDEDAGLEEDVVAAGRDPEFTTGEAEPYQFPWDSDEDLL